MNWDHSSTDAFGHNQKSKGASRKSLDSITSSARAGSDVLDNPVCCGRILGGSRWRR
jgi:hypothetical protein